jgi:hypothetical protein
VVRTPRYAFQNETEGKEEGKESGYGGIQRHEESGADLLI